MLPEPSHWKEMNINSMWPRYEKPTPPVCTCSSRSPRVTDERQKDTFLNFPVASERNIELLPPELHQKPEKFAEPNQFTKRFLFDCRARVKSLKSRGWHPWKKKKDRHALNPRLCVLLVFVCRRFIHGGGGGWLCESTSSNIVHTHVRAHICSAFTRKCIMLLDIILSRATDFNAKCQIRCRWLGGIFMLIRWLIFWWYVYMKPECV